MTTGYWTVRSFISPQDKVTLCEDCALEATNAVLMVWGEQPVSNVSEAAAIIAAQAAAHGIPNGPLAYSESGECENCKKGAA